MMTMGVAAAIPPTFPTRSRIPLMVANSFLRNQTASTFMMGMYTTAAPIPMMNLPAIIRLKLLAGSARALRMEPTAMRATKADAAVRGPSLSVRIPLGICINVYAYRYAEANSAMDADPTPKASCSV